MPVINTTYSEYLCDGCDMGFTIDTRIVIISEGIVKPVKPVKPDGYGEYIDSDEADDRYYHVDCAPIA